MQNLKLAKLVDHLQESSIIRISEMMKKKIMAGEKVYNLTLGDFSAKQFSIPLELENAIIKAYQSKYTNYPPPGGFIELRQAIASFIKTYGDYQYSTDEIVVGAGARPLIYALFKILVDPHDQVINIAPSWNNHNYIALSEATAITIQTKLENNFMPTAKEIEPYLKSASLIAFNSPSNPTGTIFELNQLKEIFDLIVEENHIRAKHQQKPLYIFFDTIYRLLNYNESKNYNILEINPAIRNYIIFVEGISKCFAATGVRVGWAFGPKLIIDKIKTILTHFGSWPATPEQFGVAEFLYNTSTIDYYLDNFKKNLLIRLEIFFQTFSFLKKQGYPVDAIAPEGAFYLSIKLDLVGKQTPHHHQLKNLDEVLDYLIENSKVGIVPFHAFSADPNLPWFRLSVGTCSIDDAHDAASALEQTIIQLFDCA